MAAYVAGDRQAFARLFARVAPRVHAFFQRSFRDVSVADELMQITFLKVHRARETYRPDLPFRPWLFTVAGHVRRDEWRKRYRLAEDAGEDEALIAADENNALTRTRSREETEDRRNEVRAAVEALPEIQRTILQLHRYEGLTFIEIAKSLGTTPGAVRQHALPCLRNAPRETLGIVGDRAGRARGPRMTTAHVRDQAVGIAALPETDPERRRRVRTCRRMRRVRRGARPRNGILAAPGRIADVRTAERRRDAAHVGGDRAGRRGARGAKAAAARRTVPHALSAWVAVVLSAIFAWVDARGAALAWSVGVECLFIELAVAAVPLAVVGSGILRGRAPPAVPSFAALGAWAALGAQGYLHFRCPVGHEGVTSWRSTSGASCSPRSSG